MHKKSWATLEVNFPCHRISLRAEKALRVICECCAGKRQHVRVKVSMRTCYVGAPVLLAQEEVRSTPPIQAATALKHASCDQKSLKNHKKCNSFENWSPAIVGGEITQEHSRTSRERFLGLFILERLGTRWRPDTQKQDKI